MSIEYGQTGQTNKSTKMFPKLNDEMFSCLGYPGFDDRDMRKIRKLRKQEGNQADSNHNPSPTQDK